MNEEARGLPRTVLAQCYGMLSALRTDAGELVGPVIDNQLAKIEAVMGEQGEQWRARRLAEQETTA